MVDSRRLMTSNGHTYVIHPCIISITIKQSVYNVGWLKQLQTAVVLFTLQQALAYTGYTGTEQVKMLDFLCNF